MAVLGVRCCCLGCALVVVYGLLTVVASVVAAQGHSSCGSQTLEHRLSSCGTGASLL